MNFTRPLPRHNPRISVQQGLFVLSLKSDLLRHLANLQAQVAQNIYQHPSRALEKPLVSGFLLKATDRAEILSDLDLMGINESTLFGGLDGAFGHCKWKHLPKKQTPQTIKPASDRSSPA